MYNLTENPTISKFFLCQLTEPVTSMNEAISFICVIEGSVDYSDPHRQYRLKRGDILLQTEAEQCLLIPHPEVLLLTVHFDYIFFRQSFGDDFSHLVCDSVAFPDRNYAQLLSALAEFALTRLNQPEKNHFLVQRQIFTLFHLLQAEFTESMEDRNSSTKQEQKLELLTAFIQNHCTEPLTLQDVADYMDYTPQYLSTFIKKHLSCTFNTWLNEERLNEALLYIKYRNDPPARIAANCGFANYNSFRKLFQQKYHLPPEDYRTDFRTKIKNDFEKKPFPRLTDSADIRDRLLNLVRFVEEEPRAIEIPVKDIHRFNIKETQPYTPNWNQVINLGDAAEFEKPQYREQIADIQSKFHFSYGRIGNILQTTEAYYMEDSPNDRNTWLFNFFRTFQVIDFLLSIGMKPHMDFGGKPFDIYLTKAQKHPGTRRDYLNYFDAVFEKLLIACINRYGFDEVSSWRFEYWLHYDQYLTKTDNPKTFCEQFSFFYQTIKRLVPQASVGAPGFNLFLSTDILQEVLATLRYADLHPDFISILFYPYINPGTLDPETGYPIRITDNPSLLHDKTGQIRYMLDEIGFSDVPIYVTEYGHIVSSMDFINDSIYQSCFILKQSLDNLGYLPVMAYFVATDYAMNYPDSAELLFGGNGLVTKDGIPKPGYHAFSFLSRLGERLIGKGEHFIITCSHKGEIQIILYNYTHFSPEYCQDPARYDSMKNPDSAFRSAPPVQVNLTLTGLKPGDYKITQYTLNKEHGSILNQWMKFSYARHLSPEDRDHLKNTCRPEIMLGRETVSDTIRISYTLKRNETMLLIYHYMY